MPQEYFQEKKPSFCITLNRYIIRFASYMITKLFKKVYVKPNEYQQNLEKLIKTVKEYTNKIYIITIANTNIKKSYGFEQNINKYNKILLLVNK